MRLKKYFFLRFFLTFVIAAQSVVMARASLTAPTNVRDSYGGIICSVQNNRANTPFDNSALSACCVNGCIFSAALRITFPDVVFLKISERASEALAVIRVLALLSQKSSLVYDARSPPVA